MEERAKTRGGQSDFHIAVIIPTYRAASTLQRVVEGIPDWVQTVIVVNDASPDDTLAIAQRYEQSDSRLVVINHDTNQGVGGAVITGYQKAFQLGAQIVIKMDSDNQMDPIYLPKLIKPIMDRQADYTKGNRFLHSRELVEMPVKRRFGNVGLSFLTKLASGYWNIFDPTNGYTAISVGLIPLLDT